MISVRAHINANKRKTTWEEVAFLKLQGKIVGATYYELTSHIRERALERPKPADDIIHDDVSVGVVVDCQVILLGELLPNAVDVMDKINEGCWPIGWSKWHYCVRPFDGIHPLKCKLLLTS